MSKKQVVMLSVLGTAILAVYLFIRGKVTKKRCYEDDYESVENEGSWQDPDLDKEFQDEI